MKFVATELEASSSSDSIFSAPTVYRPALPVSRPPARIGTGFPLFNPIRRLKNIIGTLLAPLPAEVLPPLPNEKMPWPSRKNSRFSGKNRVKRVRLTCCSSSSTWAKSVL